MTKTSVGPDADDRSTVLLRRWQEQQDVDALDELLRIEVVLLRERVRQRFGNLLDPAASASDLAQEATANLLRTSSSPSFEDPRSLRAYLLLAAWHLLQRRRRRPGAPLLQLPPESQVILEREQAASLAGMDQEQRRHVLDLALNLLRPEDREILQLVYYKGQDTASAGVALGLEPAAARKRLERARQALAQRLGRWSQALG